MLLRTFYSEIEGTFPLDIMQKDPINTVLNIRGEIIWPGRDEDDHLTK